MSAPDKPATGRLALVVGISAYEKLPGLKNPANDSALIAETLRNLGFEVIEKKDLTRRQFESTIRETSKKAKNYESVLFYFAGHGFQLGGRNYLVPADARLEDRSKIPNETLQLDGIIKDIQSRNHNTLILLDACRNNPIPTSVSNPADSGGLAQMETGSGTFVAFATQPGNITRDGAGDNSPFSLALSEHMSTEGISISDMMIRVRNSVEEQTLGTQVPWDQSSLRSQFYFNPAEESSETLTDEDLALLEQLDPALREKFMKRFGISVDAQSPTPEQEIVATIAPSLRIEPAEPEKVVEEQAAAAISIKPVILQAPEPVATRQEHIKEREVAAVPRKPGLLVIGLPDEEPASLREPADPASVVDKEMTIASVDPDTNSKVTSLPTPKSNPELAVETTPKSMPVVEPAKALLDKEATPIPVVTNKLEMAEVGDKLPALQPAAQKQQISTVSQTAEDKFSDKISNKGNEIGLAPPSKAVEPAAPLELSLLSPPASPNGIPNVKQEKAESSEIVQPPAMKTYTEVGRSKSEEQPAPSVAAISIDPHKPANKPETLAATADRMQLVPAAGYEPIKPATPDTSEKANVAQDTNPKLPQTVPTASMPTTKLLTPSVQSPAPDATLQPLLPPTGAELDSEEKLIAMAKPADGGLLFSPLGEPEEQQQTELEAGLVPLPDQTEEDKRALAIKVQNELTRLGCYRSEPDGNWGSKSARALLRFYAEQKLEPDQLEPTQDLLDRISKIDQVVCKVTIAPKPKPATKRSAPAIAQTAPAKAKPVSKAPAKAIVKQAPKPATAAKPKSPSVAKATPPPTKKLTGGALIGAFR